MKSATEKLLCCAGALALLVGCAAPTPAEKVERALESGDALYFTVDAVPLGSELGKFYCALEKALARSEIADRDAIQGTLTIFKLVLKLSGADETVRFGASSRRIGEAEFSNRIAVAASPDCSGWLWHGGGVAGDRFARLGKLPENTVAAADLGIDFSPAIRELERAGVGEKLKEPAEMLLGMSVRELLDSLSGDWRFALAAYPGDKSSGHGKFGFFVSLPDRDGRIFRRISAGISVLVPGARRDGNKVFLPGDGVTAPVLKGEPGRIALCSSPEFLSEIDGGSGTLEDRPEFRAAYSRLPKEVNGAFYIADGDLARKLGFENSGVLTGEIAKRGERAAGVWMNRDGLIEVRSISDTPMQSKLLRDLVLVPLAVATDRELRAPDVRPTPKTGDKAAREKSYDAELAQCRKNLAGIWKDLTEYRAKHGNFPEGFGAAALKKALPEMPHCNKAGYLYFGAFRNGASVKLPLVAEAASGNVHPGSVNVLLADGTVETVKIENCSMKRLCSYLHTVYRYDENDFVRLIGRASQLDAEGK